MAGFECSLHCAPLNTYSIEYESIFFDLLSGRSKGGLCRPLLTAKKITHFKLNKLFYQIIKLQSLFKGIIDTKRTFC